MHVSLRPHCVVLLLAAGCAAAVPEVKVDDGGLADGADGADGVVDGADGADGAAGDSGGVDGGADTGGGGGTGGGGTGGGGTGGGTTGGGTDGGTTGGGTGTDPVTSAYEGTYSGGVVANAAGDWGSFTMCEGDGAYTVDADGLLTANFRCNGDRGPDFDWSVEGAVSDRGAVSADASLADTWGGPPITCALSGDISSAGELSVTCDAEVSFGGGGGGGTFALTVDGWGS